MNFTLPAAARRLGGAVVLGIVLAEAARPATAAEAWGGQVSPYLWVAGLELDSSLPGGPAGVERYETRISAGAMLAAEVRYQAVGLFVDFAWLQLTTAALDAGPAFSSAELKSDFIHTTAALSYRLPLEGKFQAGLLAGARLWHVNAELTLQSGLLPGFNTSHDATWVDPVLGAEVRYELSDRWALVGRGLAGGFGVSAELAWEAFAGASYRFKNWGSVVLGYRYLHEHYDRSGYKLQLDAHGFLLGFNFAF